MNRLRVSMLLAGVCLLLAVGTHGQMQKPGGVRSVDAAAAVSRPVEPDSPAASSSVAAGPQANGAGSGMIIPRLMKFSGALLDSSGKPLSGAVDVTFALYNTEAGGSPLWFETQSVQADELGRYTALLGAMHTEGLPMDLFTSGEVRWLGIQVGLEAEQQPRVLLVSVPYALKAGDAETLGGKPASAYMLSNAQSASTSATATASSTATATAAGNGKKSTAQTSPLTACSVTSNGAATANSLALFTTACNIQNSAITQLNGNIGIGTASPSFKLEILDNNASLTGFHLKNASSGTGALAQARLENNAGALAYEGIASSTFNQFAPINGGKAFWLSYKTDAVFGNQSLNNIIFTQAGAEVARFDTSGRLGIGTPSPAAKLEVNGTAKFDGVATFTAGATFTGTISATSFFGSAAGLVGVPNSALSTAARTRGITYLAGCDSCAPLGSSDSQRVFWVNVVGPMTIVSVTCFTDGGTPAINIARDNGGQTNLFSSPLTCNGTATTSFTFSTLALNDQLDFVMAAPDGVAKRITLVVQTTLN